MGSRTLPESIRLGWKWLKVINKLGYHTDVFAAVSHVVPSLELASRVKENSRSLPVSIRLGWKLLTVTSKRDY
jgi:hypothetical protein